MAVSVPTFSTLFGVRIREVVCFPGRAVKRGRIERFDQGFLYTHSMANQLRLIIAFDVRCAKEIASSGSVVWLKGCECIFQSQDVTTRSHADKDGTSKGAVCQYFGILCTHWSHPRRTQGRPIKGSPVDQSCPMPMPLRYSCDRRSSRSTGALCDPLGCQRDRSLKGGNVKQVGRGK